MAALSSSACHRTKTSANAKRYPFTGRVVSVDAKSESATIDGDLIQGFMEPMVMSYKFKPASMLRQVAPGDAISAEVVVIEPDRWQPGRWAGLLAGERESHGAREVASGAGARCDAYAAARRRGSGLLVDESGWDARFLEAVPRQGAAGDIHLHAVPVPGFLSANEPQLRRDLQADGGR